MSFISDRCEPTNQETKMRRQLFAVAALAAFALTSGAAVAGDHGPSQYERDHGGIGFNQVATYGYPGSASSFVTSSVKVLYLNEIGDGEAFGIESANKGAEVQASLDAATAAELRAKGVQIRNIVGSAHPFKGRTIYYVK
jgi:hypothetical protein